MLGVCDKIVPGLLIGALHFGHLPTVFVPAGPMTSGLPNNEKAKVREMAAQGLVGRAELLEAESAAYHGPGTCTFYGTANSNQMLLEAMGLHVPGTAFINPGNAVREELTREAVRTVLGQAGQGGDAASTASHAQAASNTAAACPPHWPGSRRAQHRQRHGRALGHRRLHQPPDPLGGGGARCGHRDRLGRFFCAV
jgi:dihydroxyacid dehydratase/phosphogluconate dehydratase